MAQATLIGIDVGTGAVKAILMDLEGNVLETFARPYPTARPKPGHVEQDPRDWMEGVLAALDGFDKARDLGGLLGIGFCSQVNTHVFVDNDGAPLLPAIVWQDGRCGRMRRLSTPRSRPNKRGLVRRTYADRCEPCACPHGTCRSASSRPLRPHAYVLLPKDYCALKLTGEVATDPISSVGLVDSTYITWTI